MPQSLLITALLIINTRVKPDHSRQQKNQEKFQGQRLVRGLQDNFRFAGIIIMMDNLIVVQLTFALHVDGFQDFRIAIGVNKDGFREILGAAEGMKEDRVEQPNDEENPYI
ncbi:hypothetical protein [uncultured Megasphaera sp.]|nr:hypothetical protein [uncultured Megasphaera sp.]